MLKTGDSEQSKGGTGFQALELRCIGSPLGRVASCLKKQHLIFMAVMITEYGTFQLNS
jgi:hypothetical protein